MKFEKIRNLSKEEFKKEVKNRQCKSAIRTTTIKKLKTAAKIKIAIDVLLRYKRKLSFNNIAKQAKISISTIRRNIRIIKIFTQKTKGFIRSIRMIVRRDLLVESKFNLYYLEENNYLIINNVVSQI